MRTSRPVTLALGGILLLGACSGDDDGGVAATSTSSLDPGVTFDNEVTVPTTAPEGAPTTTVPLPEVETVPGEVPASFPDGFPVPEGAEVEVGSEGAVEGEIRVAVDYTVPGTDPADVHDFYVDAAAEEGWSVLLESSDGTGADFVGQLVFETDTFVGNVLVAGDGAGNTLLTITATLPD